MIKVYIHGATASAQSFNYIRAQIPGPDLTLEYESENGFAKNLDDMSQTIADLADQPLFFVGHSLGGIYSLSLAERFPNRVQGGVTISTPYGGSEIAPFLKYFVPFNRLLKEIGPESTPIKYAQKINVDVPWCNIVTTRGNSPWMATPNDGVVTVESQRQKDGIDFIEIPMNHYEILMDPQVVKIISDKNTQAQTQYQLRKKK